MRGSHSSFKIHYWTIRLYFNVAKMSTSERIERAEEMVSFWDGALRTASTQERIDLCREQLKEAREQLKEANAIYLASMNQQQAAAPAGN